MSNEQLAVYLKEHPEDTARLELLYMKNRGFLYKYIKRFFPCEEVEDLMQESYFSMIKAIRGYDESKGKFLTYWGWHLRQHLTRYTYSYSGVGINTNNLINKYNRTITELEELGEIPTDTRIAHKMGVSIEKVQELAKLQKSRVNISTDKEIQEGIALLDTQADKSQNVESTVLDAMEKEELKRDIWECVERLPEKHAEVIIRHYKNQEQYKDIAEELKVSYQQVTQRKIEAFRKMREDARTVKQLRPYIDNIRGEALKGNGVGRFKVTWTSSTERVALQRLERKKLLQEIANF